MLGDSPELDTIPAPCSPPAHNDSHAVPEMASGAGEKSKRGRRSNVDMEEGRRAPQTGSSRCTCPETEGAAWRGQGAGLGCGLGLRSCYLENRRQEQTNHPRLSQGWPREAGAVRGV